MELTTIQKCVNDAFMERPFGSLDSTVTIRVNMEVMGAAASVCDNHGTTLSSFLRKCMENLVRDYKDAKTDL